LHLRPQSFAVLHYLVEHANHLVDREKLRKVMASTADKEGDPVRPCIREIRQVLRDQARNPQFIETVPTRGYRFIGAIAQRPGALRSHIRRESIGGESLTDMRHTGRPQAFVGREAELARLQGWLERALQGARQVVFVTGEPGIGKTAILDAFLAHLPAPGGVWIRRGQCVAQHGSGEAYMPVFEVLNRLCREHKDAVLPVLRQYAPTWVVQMPWLISEDDRNAMQRTMGTTPARMLRELTEAVDVLTAQIPLVLALEDLHWCDLATLDLLVALAQRQEPARLLVLGTYRPSEVIRQKHPLRRVAQALQLHGHGVELPLARLSEETVEHYLTARFPGIAQQTQLAQWLHQRTDGNPLFLVNATEHLVQQGALVETEGRWTLRENWEDVGGIPENLQVMITQQLDELSASEQEVPEAGSVAGMEFSAAQAAASTGQEVEAVEERCQQLARRGQFLRASGASEWPDGTVATRYSFLHALYQEALYQGIPLARRRRLHRRIGERLEVGYGDKTDILAAELALHFEQGRDWWRAVRYREQAAKNALRRCAYREAIPPSSKDLRVSRLSLTRLRTPSKSSLCK
jgi:hypothetical protein